MGEIIHSNKNHSASWEIILCEAAVDFHEV